MKGDTLLYINIKREARMRGGEEERGKALKEIRGDKRRQSEIEDNTLVGSCCTYVWFFRWVNGFI